MLATAALHKILSLSGVFVFLFIAWLISVDRKNVPWRTVGWGVGLQFIFALIVLHPGILRSSIFMLFCSVYVLSLYVLFAFVISFVVYFVSVFISFFVSASLFFVISFSHYLFLSFFLSVFVAFFRSFVCPFFRFVFNSLFVSYTFMY